MHSAIPNVSLIKSIPSLTMIDCFPLDERVIFIVERVYKSCNLVPHVVQRKR